jgi:hypothetical protein
MLDELEQQIRDTFSAVPLELVRKMCPCLAGCRSVFKLLGPVMKSDTMWWKTGFEMVQDLQQYDIVRRRYRLLICNVKVARVHTRKTWGWT